MKSRIPNFYRQNAARGSVRVVTGGKRATPEDVRSAVGQILTWCLLLAVHEVMGYGKQRIDRFAGAMSDTAEMYQDILMRSGPHRADSWLAASAGAAARDFVLPADKPIKKAADRAELAQKRMAAELTWRIAAATLRRAPYRLGEKRLAEVRQTTLDNYRWFLEWAVDGDYYGYERLRRAVEQITGENVRIVDEEGSAPVFADRKY